MRIKRGTGVTFIDEKNEKETFHTYKDYGLILLDKSAPFPEPKTEYVDIPNRDGSIDLTGALGDRFVRYYNRTVEFTLVDLNYQERFNARFSRMARDIHGKRMKIIFDADPSYYYIGRVVMGPVSKHGLRGDLTVTCDCEPYKYSVVKSSDPWIWDTFNFETGIVTEGGAYTVRGSLTVTVNPGDIPVTPTFICSAQMKLTLRGETYTLPSGSSLNYDIYLRPGENELTFTGNGTVTIDYRGGAF